MDIARRLEWKILATPLVAFLLLFLGFPALVNLIYSVSDVTFETLRSPSISGFANYGTVLVDPEFWQASWFSLRFGVLTALAECVIGLALAIFLSPLIEKRSSLMAPLMLPLMVALGAAEQEAAHVVYHEEDFFGALAVTSFKFG